jgi:signal transduction histidine kinase
VVERSATPAHPNPHMDTHERAPTELPYHRIGLKQVAGNDGQLLHVGAAAPSALTVVNGQKRWLDWHVDTMTESSPPPRRTASRTRLRRKSSADRMIAQASELLGEARDTEGVLEAIARLVVPRLGDNCVIDAVDEQGGLVRVAEASADPESEALLRQLRRFPPGPRRASPAMEVLRTGCPQVIEHFDGEALRALSDDPEYRDIVARIGPTTSISVPATARGRILAVITFGMAKSGRVHAPEDVEFAERLARQAALALDSQRLYQSERQARGEAERTAERLTRLERLTAALSEALTPTQVAQAVLQQGIPALGAVAGCIGVVEEGGDALQMLAFQGFSDDVQRQWPRIPLDMRVPLTAAAQTGQPILLEGRDRWDHDPPFAFIARAETQALAALPLAVHGKVIGAISFSLADSRGVTEADRPLMGALADQCALALDRAQLYESERRARAEVEATHERVLLLADAQQRFVMASHDLRHVLETVAQRLGDVLGGTCYVRTLSGDGQLLETPVVYNPDPTVAAAMREVLSTTHARADQGLGGEALRTGQTLLVACMEPDDMRLRGAPEGHHELDRFPIHSAMGAPVFVRGQPFGVLQMARHTADRPYQEGDRALLDQLAQRAAVAIAKARALESERMARGEAERALELRDELLAVVSHDLRTPLGTISMATTLLSEGIPEGHPERPQVGAIVRAVHTMDQLIEDLVDLALMDGGQLELDRQPEPLGPMVDHACELLRPQAAARGQRLEVRVGHPEARVSCDRRRVVQILSNLISNAIKFTPDNELIVVGAQERGGAMELSVRDSGPGVSDEARHSMFERFWTQPPRQASPTTKKGLGLGLTIVRRLVEAHGSQVQVESVPEGGTAFRFSLPVV